jgi:hypothetical protein
MITFTYGEARTSRFRRVARYPGEESFASRFMWYCPRFSEPEDPFDFSKAWFWRAFEDWTLVNISTSFIRRLRKLSW